MKKERQRILNYFLSIAFVVFLFALLVLMLLMGRFVLSEAAPIGSHVQNTKSLLEDISEVEKAASQNNETDSKSFLSDVRKEEFAPFNGLGATVTDISYNNVNENKTIVTLFIDHEIDRIDNFYFVKIEDYSEIWKNQMLFYDKTAPKRGYFILADDEGMIRIETLTDGEIIKVSKDEVLGRALFIE